MTPEEYNLKSNIFELSLKDSSKRLKSIAEGNRNDWGIVKDEVKFSKAYKEAKAEYDNIFSAYRKFNKSVPKKVRDLAHKMRRKK